MATRRSTGSGGQSAPQRSPPGTQTLLQNFAGVEDQQVESNPDRFIGELFRGPQFQKKSIPTTAPSGGTITVSGRIRHDNPGRFITPQRVRVRAESPALGSPIQQEFQMTHGQTRTFTLDIPIPPAAEGETFALTLKAQAKGTPGWNTGETIGPRRINIVSESAHTASEFAGLLPYAAAGGGVGLLASSFTDRSPALLGGGGALAGAAYKYSGAGLSIPNIPTTQVVIVGAGLFGIAAFLQSTGAADVLQPVGEAAGGAVRSGVQAGGQRLSSPR